MQERVAALEKEQLQFKKYVAKNIKNDEQVIKTVKAYRDDIKKLLKQI